MKRCLGCWGRNADGDADGCGWRRVRARQTEQGCSKAAIVSGATERGTLAVPEHKHGAVGCLLSLVFFLFSVATQVGADVAAAGMRKVHTHCLPNRNGESGTDRTGWARQAGSDADAKAALPDGVWCQSVGCVPV